ncbi:oxygen-insensitive NADPH nitroreductase [Terribacillus saccharophilus]|uniref:Nitroreductase A n=1 Tax=Terribacillus saccharophilus TaxID=361277 RepID=A0A268A8X1_9BACI|nr:oxygen-insensitive NADPH nitroreductase [Terribacillus saccharophilus]PAD20565.1 nitroreductase A [Terribacillus saccharophilus]
MSDVLQTILSHKSVRSFTSERLTEEQIKELVSAAQAASTSSFLQAYSIIGVSDPLVKKELSTYAGSQEYVVNNGHFFVFCADFYRHKEMANNLRADISETIQGTEALLIGTIDASLAAQNLAIAAESMGLGICYIGGLRNNLAGVSASLGVPAQVLPLFGIAVGYPEKVNEKKPRLPFGSVYHENRYNVDKGLLNAQLEEYDRTIQSYYVDRIENSMKTTWTEQATDKLRIPKRVYIKDFITQKGWAKH